MCPLCASHHTHTVSLVPPRPPGSRFFIFLLVMCSMSVFSACLFRTTAAITRNEVIAQAANSLVLVMFMQNGGFTIAYSTWQAEGE